MINIEVVKYIWLREIIKYKDIYVKFIGRYRYEFMYVL